MPRISNLYNDYSPLDQRPSRSAIMAERTTLKPPNVILILADDMGYGDFGAFNEGRSDTPALDRLVADGLTLRQHYSGSPVCAPARAVLMTGRYAHRTGAIDTYEGRGLDRLALRERTMGDVLRDAGYTTGLVGKWHNGALDPRYHPNARGFDEFAGFRGGWQDFYEWRLDRNGSFERTDGRYLTDVFTEEAISFIRRHSNNPEPFLLHLSYNAPHWPYQAPEHLLVKYRERGCTEGEAMIYAMVESMDQGIANVLDEVRAQGIEEDTIVMFTSDNGPDLFDDWGYDTMRFNLGLHGAKTWTYEGGIRVPMLVRWPGAGISGGGFIDDMVHFADWLPTLASMCGAETPTDRVIDGRDVSPLLYREGPVDDAVRCWQWNRYTPVIESNAAIRDGDWKLVRPKIAETFWTPDSESEIDSTLKYRPGEITEIIRDPEPEREIPPPPPAELYNIANDPEERNDLAATYPDCAARLLADLERWFEDVEAERATIDDQW
jgi:arylsulfatase A-like enzyme